MSDEKIRAAIKVECDRQHVGEDRQAFLKYAWDELYWGRDLPFHEARLRAVAHILEPSNGGHYRTTPVSFNGVVGGVFQDNIPRAMESWVEFFNVALGYSRIGFLEDDYANAAIKEFLDIHPFSDGNGRTAWLLRVWILNQWDDPQPLPDYFGESNV